jgi:MFS family permease
VSATERRVSATSTALTGRPRSILAGVQRDWSERLPPPWTITAALAVVYLILAPSSPDLAAASYRSYLFAQHGFLLWDNSWYGGHHLLAYSLLAPPLGALIGPRLLAALSMTLATALFTALIDGRFPPRAVRVAGAWFALGAAIGLLSSRVPFDLGLAIGLAALLAARHRRPGLALLLALLSSVASPVAGAFLALAFLAWCLAGPKRARPALLTAAALAPIALLTLVFPEGGSQPFVASAFYPALAGVLLIAGLIPSEQRTLRIGALLYACALIGSYLLATAVGGNADRLGSLVAGPIAACVLLGGAGAGRPGAARRARVLLVLAPFLLYWQANAPVADFAAADSDPAVHASYYAPLLGELRALGVGYGARAVRVEAVPTVDHWEARWIAPDAMLARGWERQLDRYRNGLFYNGTARLSAAAYHAWLQRSAVDYVALPDAPLDYSAHSEASLLRSGRLGYLREVWRSAHWRLFAVREPRPLADAPARLERVGTDSLSLSVPRAGDYTVRVRFSPYWALAGGSGCVARAPEDWTRVEARRAGRLRLVISFSLGRIFSRGPRCR